MSFLTMLLDYILIFVSFLWNRFKPYIIGGLIVLFIVLIFSFRSCVKDNDDIGPTLTFEVKSVLRGNAFEAPAGLFGRKTRVVTLSKMGVPGLDQPFGIASRDFLAKMIANKKVDVYNASNRFGDLSGVVWTPEGWCCQREIIRNGLGWCLTSTWQAEEKEARKAKRGIWTIYQRNENNCVELIDEYKNLINE